MSKKQKTFVIIDGNALVHRSFHALPPFTTQDGRVVNAVYGFTSILLKMLKELSPDYVVVCFDRAEKTFRHEAFEAYKAHRKKQPDELYAQIPLIYDVLKTLHITSLDKAGYEADDLIGTLARKNESQKGIKTIIVTGDLDTLQLVDKNTSVYTFKKGISDTLIYDEEAVKERFGLKPEQLIDFKALRGDPSDNIPGVKGIGEKTAISFIAQFKDLDHLYKNIDSPDIKERYRKLLQEQKEEAYQSKELVTIQTSVDIPYDLEIFLLKPFHREKVIKLFQDLEFKSLISKIPKIQSPVSDSGQADIFTKGVKKETDFSFVKEEGVIYTTITEEKAFEEFLHLLRQQKAFAFDTETTSLDFTQARLLGMSFSFQEKQAYYLVMNADFLTQLKPLLEDVSIKKIAHNAKYDMLILKNEGVNLQGLYFDTMIASYLTSASRTHGLDHLAFVEFGHEMISYEDLVGKGKLQIPLEQVPIEQLSWYACEDVDYTWRLYEVFQEQLQTQELESLFHEIEIPLIPVLVDMEYTGVHIDVDFLKSLSKKHAKSIKTLEEKIFHLAGVKFNIKSPIQLKQVLFEQMGLSAEGLKKTKTGISTAASELEKLRDTHEIIELIMQYRELTKLKSTYIDALPKLVSPKTNRVHTSFNQTVAATGRLSSSDPNLQNIPIKTDIGREIRHAFVAQKGYKIVDLDYSQIELRIMASLSQDEEMMRSFREGIDIHSVTASKINNVEMHEVTSQMRREAKAVNFGILYGMGYVGLSKSTGISPLRAKEFIKKYFELYPGVYEYIVQTKENAKDLGYAQTMFGRRRYLPDLYSGLPQLRAAAERMAVNMPIQGTNADIIKKAMIKIHAELPTISPESRMILQVHDNLVFEVPAKDLTRVTSYIKETMEQIVTLNVPLVVEAKAGDNWGEV